MRYSIVMPYYQRPELRFTLDSFVEYYQQRKDIEVLIVEDSKNFKSEKMHKELNTILEKYESKIRIVCAVDPKESFCPSSKYNLGVRMSSGTHIMLTNPEIPHNFNLFDEIDKIDFKNTYLVCSCASVTTLVDRGTFFNSDLGFSLWYQHSVHRNALYHFCTIISKENYNKIGGFDERFSKGIAFDDDNFVKRVQKNGLDIITRDDLYTYHIEHQRDYSLTDEEKERLRKINHDLWAHQLETINF
jgi:GT2 family glycosyltransferase